ncbi:ABC transporter substrate-binding protein [Burkholderia sp. Nafp2/4-1b]|uniref:ABC transporter substrate-binding protein n=1 Tax=Burkholderia sp. Nafp2/4-1b TaxID=2116686 RepID=UPI001F0970C1|nr:ABC transporter substrate-binding protein [Burkholderia sp. Nafp2/4-1b]
MTGVVSRPASSRPPERRAVTLAVGGRHLIYHLPLTIAERRGYFRQQGLELKIVDFAGGAKSLQALVGGSADVVAGAYEHTILMHARRQPVRAFVLQGQAPQMVFAVSNKTLPNYRSLADLRGKTIGVSAPGSSTNIMANFVLAKEGIRPDQVAFVGVGTASAAVAAMRTGRIDAIVNVDPVISILERDQAVRVIFDTRKLADTRSVFGGTLPAGCLYTNERFIKRYPYTTQAMTTAMVQALRWLQTADATAIVQTVPESYLLGDRTLYLEAWRQAREAISPDGRFPADGPSTALRMLQASDPRVRDQAIDIRRTFTNAFVQRAQVLDA